MYGASVVHPEVEDAHHVFARERLRRARLAKQAPPGRAAPVRKHELDGDRLFQELLGLHRAADAPAPETEQTRYFSAMTVPSAGTPTAATSIDIPWLQTIPELTCIDQALSPPRWGEAAKSPANGEL